MPTEIEAGQDLNNYVSPGLYFCDELAQSVDNIPPDSITGAFSLFVEKTGAYGNGVKQTFTEHNPGLTYIRLMSDTSMSHWSDWKPIATATPPQEYNLPLVEGFTGYAKYSKDQFGRVLVMLQDIVRTDGTAFGVNQNTLIGALPVGFRPPRSILVNAVATAASGYPIYGIYQIWIDPTGEVYCLAESGISPGMVRGSLWYAAAD